MQTETNGLYYMRARYYNPDIKRFINQDVVDGDITNSQSLNKYSYVQGNPVSLTDPFGLFPIDKAGVLGALRIATHTALDIAGIFWDGADLINAYLYYKEGNTMMAMTSMVAAVPFMGSVVAESADFVFMGSKYAGKVSKAAKYLKTGSKLAGYTAQATISTVNTYYSGLNVIDGIENGTLSKSDVFELGANILGTVVSTTQAVSSASHMTRLLAADGVGEAVKKAAKEFHNNNGGSVDLSYFGVGNKGGSGSKELFLPDEYYENLNKNLQYGYQAPNTKEVYKRLGNTSHEIETSVVISDEFGRIY